MADITDVSIPDPKMHEFLTDVEKWVLERIENQPFLLKTFTLMVVTFITVLSKIVVFLSRLGISV